MWKDLSAPWQAAFEEAWTACRSGCVPIGGALCDRNGVVVARDHNRSAEPDTLNRRISHAEANILRALDTDSGLDLYSLVLYTTMEPCPMCMGTCVMSGIRHLRFAARDPYCGFTYLADEAPYFRRKNLDYTQEGGEREFVQIAIQSVYEMGYIARGGGGCVVDEFRRMLPEAVAAAEKLYAENALAVWNEANLTAGEVYDRVLSYRV